MSGLMNVAEIAEALRVSNATAWRLVREGVLPSIKIGRSYRIPAEKLAEWMAKGGEIKEPK